MFMPKLGAIKLGLTETDTVVICLTENQMPMDRTNICLGRCYRDTFGAVYKVEAYDGNEVRYAVYDLTYRGKLTERQHSESWANFLADLESEIECPQPDQSSN
jgi:hypothetical protein